MERLGSKQRLGVGALVGRSFALLFRRFDVFALICIVPSILVGLIQVSALPDPARVSARGGGIDVFGAVAASAGLSMLVGMVVVGAVTLAAYDITLGRPVRVPHYVGRTLASAIPILVLGVVFYLALILGLVLLIVPGLYLLARYWVMTPAILIERAGFSGLSRAAELTRGYRWPVLGSILIMFVLLALVGFGTGAALNLATARLLADLPGSPDFIEGVVIESVVTALHYAILSIFTALLYARLREIKEGLGMEDLASVFE